MVFLSDSPSSHPPDTFWVQCKENTTGNGHAMSIQILIIDDNPLDQLLLQKHLNRQNRQHFEISCANTYEEGFQYLLQGGYDIALVDHLLDGTVNKGLELIENIRQVGIHTPVILLTHLSENQQAHYDLDVAAMKAGANDFLDKQEITPAYLERTIRYTLKNFEYEKELLLSRQRLSMALEATQSYVFEINWTTGAMSCDEQLEDMLGFIPQHLEEWLEGIPLKYRNYVRKELEIVVQNEVLGHVFYWRKSEDICIQARFMLYKTPHKSEPMIIGVFSDISPQKSFEARLKDHNAELEYAVKERTLALGKTNQKLATYQRHLEHILEAVSVGIVVTNAKGKVYLTNQAARHILPIQNLANDISAWDFAELNWSHADGSRFYPKDFALLRVLNEQKVFSQEVIIPTKEGMRFYQVVGVPVLSPEHETEFAVVTFSDVSHIKEAQRELQLAREKADLANQAKSAFLASMSHEIRTPMNAILGFAQLLQENKDLPGQLLHKVNIILHNGEFLLQLINNILEMSKIEAGHVHLQTNEVNLYRFFEDIYNVFSIQAQKKGLAFRVNLEDIPPAQVVIDSLKVKQILINVISNALKFTENGEIRIQVRLGKMSPSTLNIQIQDSGCGIPEDKQALIFEPFEQVYTQNKSEAGTGLGLSICKEYCHLMRGDIQVESTPGIGSTFHIQLPVDITTVLTHTSQELSPRPELKVSGLKQGTVAPKLLIADDSEDNQKLLVDLLTPLGFLVKTANNGQEVLKEIKADAPDLLLLNMNMPLYDGFKVLKDLNEHTIKLPVIAVTANAFAEEHQKMLDLGAQDIIVKPYHIQKTLIKIADVLNVAYEYEPLGTLDKPKIHSKESLSFRSDIKAALMNAISEGDLDRVIDLLEHESQEKNVQHLIDLANEYDYDNLMNKLEEIPSADTSKNRAI